MVWAGLEGWSSWGSGVVQSWFGWVEAYLDLFRLNEAGLGWLRSLGHGGWFRDSGVASGLAGSWLVLGGDNFCKRKSVQGSGNDCPSPAKRPTDS